MSTLLTDLDSSPPVSSKDGDLVDQILKEMNGPPLPPPAAVQNTAMNSYTMSTNPATAHVIGGADVAAELDAKRAIDQGARLAARL